ncbi:putative endo-beta-N-acetylglucosaminidase precursor [compost metagenome]
MKLKRDLVVLAAVSCLGMYIVNPSQADEVELKSTPVVNTVDTSVLTKAIVLNQDIKSEIEKIYENDRKVKETWDDFVTFAKRTKFKNYDLRTVTGLNGYQLDSLLKGTGLEGLGSAYAEAESLYGVSAIALVAMSAHESTWGTSSIANSRNNLFGYQAYDSDTNSAKRFKTRKECILTVAKHLSENYLSENGAYYNGPTFKGVNVRYASDKEWTTKVENVLISLTANL